MKIPNHFRQSESSVCISVKSDYFAREQISLEETFHLGDIKFLWKLADSSLYVLLTLLFASAEEQFSAMLTSSNIINLTTPVIWISAVAPSHAIYTVVLLWSPNNSTRHLLDEPNKSGSFLGFRLDSQMRKNYFSWQFIPSSGLWLIPHHAWDIHK